MPESAEIIMSIEYFDAATACNRFGLGARPGDLGRIGGDARHWLLEQLKSAPLLSSAQLRNSASILADAAAIVSQRRALRSGSAVDPAALQRLPQLYRPIYAEEVRARLSQAVTTEQPFLERLVYFWSNHFAVSVDKQAVFGVAGSFEREVIRPHVLGRFEDLLLAAEQHPAMLLYLDNQRSVGPNSPQAQRAERRGRALGLNENLAREILELHTLGVDGGYTQADVTSFAKALTGWSLGARGLFQQGVAGEFVFRDALHEPGAQTICGRRYAEGGIEQGRAVLRDLAVSSATAHHLATKLARHFIADDPSPPVVDRLAQAFERSGGDLPTVYRALIDCPEAWTDAGSKYKTPQDYALSIYRGLQLPVEDGPKAIAVFELLGQRQFSPGSPAGWPDRSADWDGAAALMKRIEFADALSQRLGDRQSAMDLGPVLLGARYDSATKTALARAASPAQAMTLLLTAPEFMRR